MKRNLDLGLPGESFWCYAFGLGLASVCSSLPTAQAVAEELNRREKLTGIPGVGKWKPCAASTFRDKVSPNPCPCETQPETHQHFLLEW
jgi:hypothetical protein